MIIRYNFADGTASEVEVSNEIGSIIIKARREEENLSRKEHNHCLSIEGFLYEGVELTTGETIETFLKKEDDREQLRKRINAAFDQLSEKQYRRLIMRIDGHKLHEIAEIEQVKINAVRKSISFAKKNFKKFFKNGCKKRG